MPWRHVAATDAHGYCSRDSMLLPPGREGLGRGRAVSVCIRAPIRVHPCSALERSRPDTGASGGPLQRILTMAEIGAAPLLLSAHNLLEENTPCAVSLDSRSLQLSCWLPG